MGHQETTDSLDAALATVAERFAEGLCADMIGGPARRRVRITVPVQRRDTASIGRTLRALAATLARLFGLRRTAARKSAPSLG
jgi:hypothetical protein